MRAFSIIGPSQSGKTTLAAALAALDDPHPRRLELAGGTAVTRFSYMGEDWAAFDIPGTPEGLARAGTALAACDAVVLCLPADAGAADLCAPWIRLVEASGLPTILFVNRIDAATDRLADIVAALQSYSGHAIVLRQVPIREGDKVVGAIDLISERAWHYNDNARSSLIEMPPEMLAREREARTDLLEHLADFDDALLEQLIEDQQPMTEQVYEVATRALQHHDLLAALIGSAAHGNGIQRLMKSLRHEAPQVADAAARLGDGAVAAAVAADNVKHLGKVVLLRALADGLKAGSALGGESIGGLVDIDTRTTIGPLKAGEIGIAVKADHLSLDKPVLAADQARPAPGWAQPHRPNLRLIVTPKSEKDDARLAGALARLCEIDPGLALDTDGPSGHTVLCAQSPTHARWVVETLAATFGVEVETSPLAAQLCETIRKPVDKHYRHRKQTGGAGQFADVVIKVRPLPRGEGFAFSEEVKGGAVPRNYIPAVEQGARDALAAGPHGHPVVDVAVTLVDGKSHSVDSSDYAFRTAGRQAVKEALEEAGTVVLQPINRVTIFTPSVFSGALVPAISALKGQVLGFEADPDAPGWDRFNALLPAAAEADLFNTLASATRGTAWFVSELDHYEEAYDLAHA